jgi:hypothetical protein
MSGSEHDVPDEPGCPLVGLVADPRTRCTYPSRHHRCHAGRFARTIKPYYQVTVCLGPRFSACDHYLVWERRTIPKDRPEGRPGPGGTSPAPPPGPDEARIRRAVGVPGADRLS